MYIHMCGTSTVILANLVFLGASNAKILAFDRTHKEIKGCPKSPSSLDLRHFYDILACPIVVSATNAEKVCYFLPR
jgi:hypothetical protein